MLRKSAAALLMSTTCLLGGSAFAQTATTPGTAPTAPISAMSASATGSKFVTDQAISQFRASKFVGLDVYGADNEKIGSISEILIDGQGNARAVVIGVGGLLGIGQKNVAVPWSAVTWSNDRPPSRSASGTGGEATPAGTVAPTTGGPRTAGAPSTAGTPAGATTGPGGATTGPAGVSATAAPATPARSPAEQAAYNGYPNHANVTLTKAELQDAPAFKYYSEPSSSSGAPTGMPTGPRQ